MAPAISRPATASAASGTRPRPFSAQLAPPSAPAVLSAATPLGGGVAVGGVETGGVEVGGRSLIEDKAGSQGSHDHEEYVEVEEYGQRLQVQGRASHGCLHRPAADHHEG